MSGKNAEIIEFVKKTTEAINLIGESTKGIKDATEAIKNQMANHEVVSAVGFSGLSGKMDGLLTMFKYVIAPLVGGILALVGIKMIFKL